MCAGPGHPRRHLQTAGRQDGGRHALQGHCHLRHALPAQHPAVLRQGRPQGPQTPAGMRPWRTLASALVLGCFACCIRMRCCLCQYLQQRCWTDACLAASTPASSCAASLRLPVHPSLCQWILNTAPLQEVGVHMLAGAATLSQDPLPHAVAVLPLVEAVNAPGGQAPLPEGCQRLVVSIDGTESDEEVSQLQVGPCSGLSPERGERQPVHAWFSLRALAGLQQLCHAGRGYCAALISLLLAARHRACCPSACCRHDCTLSWSGRCRAQGRPSRCSTSQRAPAGCTPAGGSLRPCGGVGTPPPSSTTEASLQVLHPPHLHRCSMHCCRCSVLGLAAWLLSGCRQSLLAMRCSQDQTASARDMTSDR